MSLSPGPATPCDAGPYMPHRPPMRWLDRIERVAEGEIECSVVLGPDHLFADGDGVPPWVGIELMAQAIAAYGGVQATRRGEPVRIGFLVSTRAFDCRPEPLPLGQTLSARAREVTFVDTGLASFDCTLETGGEEIARARINVYQPADPSAVLAGATDLG